MKFNPEIHHRRSIRLRGYDYSRNGAYFVTICSWNRECLFGSITGVKSGKPEMVLNEYGEIVRDEWSRTALIRKEIDIDEFIVMPNHFHGIVFIRGRGDRPVAQMATITNEMRGDRPVAPTEDRPGPRPQSIGSFLAGFKSIATKRINEIRQTPSAPVWQRNYYERIVRDEIEFDRIREYIIDNPANWKDDENNPANIGSSSNVF